MDTQNAQTIGSSTHAAEHTPRPATSLGPPAPPNFVFDSKGPLSRLTDAQILKGLRRFVQAHKGRPLTIHTFGAWPGRPCSMCTLTIRFGSWKNALKRIGVNGGRNRVHPPEYLVEKLEAAWQKLGRRPGAKMLYKTAHITDRGYVRHWGSLRAACEAIDAFHRGQITREELLRGSPRPPKPRTSFRPSLRFAILRRDGFRCQLCGRGATTQPPVELEIDHIVPVSKGGDSQESNLRVLCRDCNRGRGDGRNEVE